jgi:phenylacetate-CoA ligase
MILGTEGAVVPGSLFPHVFKDYDYAIRQFQVVQEEPGRILLKVVKAPRFDARVFDELLDRLRQYLGQGMRIDVAFVDEIPLVRTGKRQETLSKVPIDFQRI